MSELNLHRKILRSIGCVFAFVLPVTLPLGVATAGMPPAALFAAHGILEVTIEAPMAKLMDVRPDKEYLAGHFSYTDADGSIRRFAIKLRTRGNYRRDKEHCDFAPILLNFGKTEVAGTLFDGQHKLKLVTQCMTNDGEYTKILLREYLAYRLFQDLTDISYGVRLLRIKYVDMQSGQKVTRFAFVIEDDKAVAKRNALKVAKTDRVSDQDHDPARQSLVHLFEFMIGNTEYSLVNPEPDKQCCHNMDVLSADGGPPYIALPFDFDFAGLVNASYAEPNPRYPVSSVRTRYYKGLCSTNDLLPETIRLFERRRDDMFRAIDELSNACGAARRAVGWPRRYIESFYDIISDPDRVQKELLDKCDNPDARQ